MDGGRFSQVNRGKWPWVRGKVYLDECNLRCSAVAATRDIRAGEELIIDYGTSAGTFELGDEFVRA
jgi:hypothetical protein